jgi:F-type H+-transporting ATPase subunit b
MHQAFMNHLIVFGSIVDDAKSTAGKFGLNTPDFVAQCISFCLVALLLYLFAYKPILKVLEERRQRIAEGLTNADKIKAELERTEAARIEILEKANGQANKLIEEARGAAARVREDETQKAIASAEQIITKAREAAAAEHAKMLTDLKREVGRLVVQTTATVTGKILTPEDQKRLAEETSRQIA